MTVAVAVSFVLVLVVVGDTGGVTFLRRRGRSAGMSVAVYLRTRGLSASATSPVPALFNYCFILRLRDRYDIRECSVE